MPEFIKYLVFVLNLSGHTNYKLNSNKLPIISLKFKYFKFVSSFHFNSNTKLINMVIKHFHYFKQFLSNSEYFRYSKQFLSNFEHFMQGS